jgi:hypothetical protein
MTRLLAVCLLLSACKHTERDKPAPPTTQKGEKRAHETLVYVDGVPRASLSIAEAPKAATLHEYLDALGVHARTVHVYRDGNAVVADVNAPLELGAGVRPRVGGAEVSAIAIYVDKPPPTLPVQGIPYLDEPVRGGTRVNLDGRLAARIKRNRIEGVLAELDDGSYRFADFLEQQKLGAARALELVQADESIVRVPDQEVANVRFAAEEHQHGQMRFRFGELAVSAIAVNVYSTASPPQRAVAAPSKATEARGAGFSGGCDVALGGGRASSPW